MDIQERQVDGQRVLRLESSGLQVDVAPAVGGRIISLRDRVSGHEFLWRNTALRLEQLPAGSPYDPNFYGGIDELIPNDMPESINGLDEPDHGELWTTSLDASVEQDELVLTGRLPVSGLHYERRMRLDAQTPRVDFHYRIHNPTRHRRDFMWKLHPALAIAPGDVIECPARKARAVDPRWSRWTSTEPFDWPSVEGQRADIIPPRDGTMDFLCLYELDRGEIGWRRPATGLGLTYTFDKTIFPYAYVFASYGGFRDHYVAVIEPCTAMDLSVNQAVHDGACATHLDAGETLETKITLEVQSNGAAT